MENGKRFPKINKLKDYFWIVSMCVLNVLLFSRYVDSSKIKNVGTLTEVLTENKANILTLPRNMVKNFFLCEMTVKN